MDAQQYYYTSYVHTASGKAGFQIKAMSAGIPSDLQATLAHLIAYRVPPTCNIQDYKTHPVALRYAYEGPGRCILLCTQSCGKDEYGRPGNFFAHALLLDEELLQAVPPVFFWRSAFWLLRDPVEREQIDSLPLLSISGRQATLDAKKIEQFLAQDNRRVWLYKLLCAIIHSHSSHRRIVILDSAEHVALWIAAASCLLPPACRPLLTFATYHHDPYQAQFLITGTTRDSLFKASSEDYFSYFVLNALEGHISTVDSSLYAWLAVQPLGSEDCHEIQQALFAAYAHYFPYTTMIDEHLDLLVLYAQAQDNSQQDRVSILKDIDLPSSLYALAHSAMSILSREEYTALIEPCVSIHMQSVPAYTDHLQFIRTLFSSSQRMGLALYFWQVYLTRWCTILQAPVTPDKAIELLHFWFTLAPSDLPAGYPIQQYFLHLAALLRRERAVLQTLVACTTEQPWHHSLQLIAMPHTNALLQLGQHITALRQVARRVWLAPRGRLAEDAVNERCKQLTLEEEMSLLFASDNPVEQYQQCVQMYLAHTPTRFWPCYWQHFTQLLLSRNVDRVFAILSFWFDHSYDLLLQQQSISSLSRPVLTDPASRRINNTIAPMSIYLPQEFFLGLGGVLERALQIHQVQAIAPLIQHKGLNSELYPWYALIASYFHGEPCSIS